MHPVLSLKYIHIICFIYFIIHYISSASSPSSFSASSPHFPSTIHCSSFPFRKRADLPVISAKYSITRCRSTQCWCLLCRAPGISTWWCWWHFLCFLYTFDFSHSHLAADVFKAGAEREFKGFGDSLVKFWKSDGIKGLYQGFNLLVQGGCIIYQVAFFGIYDTANGILLDPKNTHIFIWWMTAHLSHCLQGLTWFPFDIVCHRMMMKVGCTETDIPCTCLLACWKRVACD